MSVQCRLVGRNNVVLLVIGTWKEEQSDGKVRNLNSARTYMKVEDPLLLSRESMVFYLRSRGDQSPSFWMDAELSNRKKECGPSR